MEVIKAEILGFCFGVRRAVELAYKALQENYNKKVYSLGPLIHNELVLSNLVKKGLLILEEDDLSSVPEQSVIIIRAHGVSPKIITFLKEKGCKIIDATCPRVKASQKMVKKFTENQKTIILTGDKNHGEVKGISGYAQNNIYLLQNEQETKDIILKINADKQIVLLSQTTFSPKTFNNIGSILLQKYKNLEIFNTICPATKERQDALYDLCKKVEGILVIGGKNSANTIRLFETAKKQCRYVAHIQTSKDIPGYFSTLKSVGITAGASTPDEIIEEVKNSLILTYNSV